MITRVKNNFLALVLGGSATEHLGMCTLLSPFCEVSKSSTAFQTMDVPGDEAVQASAKSLPAVDVDDVKFEKLSLKEATCDTKIEFTQEELKICTEVAKALRKSKSDGGGLNQNQIRPREVALITLISKCRVDKAVKKYTSFIDTLNEYKLCHWTHCTNPVSYSQRN